MYDEKDYAGRKGALGTIFARLLLGKVTAVFAVLFAATLVLPLAATVIG